jgi:hypothetical protein
VSDAKLLDLEVKTDDKNWKSDLISVDVLNIPFTGPALPLALMRIPAMRSSRRSASRATTPISLLNGLRACKKTRRRFSARRGEQVEMRWGDADSRLDDEVAKGESGLAAGACSWRSRALEYSGPRHAPSRQKQRQLRGVKTVNLTV